MPGSVELSIDARSRREVERQLAKIAKIGGGKIPKELRKSLRRGVTPAMRAVQSAAMGLPATTGKSTGLRRRIAKATRIQVVTARDPVVRLVVSRSVMGDQAALPLATNRGSWRHRVYGGKNFVTQTSRKGWFDETAASREPGVFAELERAVSGLEREVN